MAASPRGRSGTVNKKDIVIYEDEPRVVEDDLRKSGFGVEVEESQDHVSEEEKDDCDILKSFSRQSFGSQRHEDSDIEQSVEPAEREEAGWRKNVSGQGRDFSNNTAIHVVYGNRYLSDPFVDEEEEEEHAQHALEDVYEEEDSDEDEDDQELEDSGRRDYDDSDDPDHDRHSTPFDGRESQDTSFNEDLRKVSEFSTLPDEMDPSFPPAPTPPVWRAHSSYHTSSTKATPPRSGTRLLSSPQTTSQRQFSPAASPHVKDGRFVSSPLARHQQYSSAFRNPSSVREIQMSSPSPPPSGLNQTPRSARQRRLEAEALAGSRSGTPSRNPGVQSSRVPSNIGSPMTPSRNPHQNAQKEYPLVLLHCSFSAPPLPYSPSVVRTVLPDSAQETLMLLREKLGPTVMERGILIPHPCDDYELLEERVLESLELKTPRVGKCGHFIGSDSRKSSANTDGQQEDNVSAVTERQQQTIEPKCKTCGKHIAYGHTGCEGDNHKRWDIRVYASNGLMRAGAWSTAWREMEKVDIEIGIWLSEDMRLALERESLLEEERENVDDYYHEDGPEEHDSYDQTEGLQSTSIRTRSAYQKGDISPASTAACSRFSGKRPQSRSINADNRETLSTLLVRYVKRNLFRRTDLLLQIFVVVLALTLYLQWQGKPIVADDQTMTARNIDLGSNNAAHPSFEIVDPDPGVQAKSRKFLTGSPMTETVTEYVQASIPACTFEPGQESHVGMTALPADLAKSVLGAALTATSESPAATTTPQQSILEEMQVGSEAVSDADGVVAS